MKSSMVENVEVDLEDVSDVVKGVTKEKTALIKLQLGVSQSNAPQRFQTRGDNYLLMYKQVRWGLVPVCRYDTYIFDFNK